MMWVIILAATWFAIGIKTAIDELRKPVDPIGDAFFAVALIGSGPLGYAVARFMRSQER